MVIQLGIVLLDWHSGCPSRPAKLGISWIQSSSRLIIYERAMTDHGL